MWTHPWLARPDPTQTNGFKENEENEATVMIQVLHSIRYVRTYTYTFFTEYLYIRDTSVTYGIYCIQNEYIYYFILCREGTNPPAVGRRRPFFSFTLTTTTSFLHILGMIHIIRYIK